MRELNKKDIEIACPKGFVKGALFRSSDDEKMYVYDGKKWIKTEKELSSDRFKRIEKRLDRIEFHLTINKEA